MDKTGIIVVSLCVVLLGWWFMEQKKITEQQARHQVQMATARGDAATNAAPASDPTPAAGDIPVTLVFDTNAPEQTLVVTNDRAIYTFTTRGGGIKQVDLLDYPQIISARWKGQITNSARLAALNANAPIPVMALMGSPAIVGDGHYRLARTASGVRAEKNLPDGIRVVKHFQFSSNFLINASIKIENTSSKPLNLPAQEVVIGTATPMDADDNGQTEGAMWFDGATATDQPMMWFDGTGFGCSAPTPRPEFRAGNGNVYWAAAHNQFFALAAMTATNGPAQQMVARSVVLPRFQNVGIHTNVAAPKGIQTALVYPAISLSAGGDVERDFLLFTGPKEYRKLAQIAEQQNNHVDQVMNWGTGFASFWGVGTFFAKLLLSAMNGLHDLTHLNYGWVIVLITFIIKLLFWPLTAASTRSMKKMQALAPEANALREKYKDEPQKLTQKQWELWRKHKVNPMSGCLPMLVQMPVFIGFFIMIRSAIELRGASFLWASDLSKPDTLFMIPGITFIPFISTPDGLPFNLLPLLMGGAMLWQSHLTPASPGMDPVQQKMMRWLPAIFILFLYNYSSGLALYWTVNNLLTILQTKLTKTTNLVPAAAPAPATNPALTPASKKKK